MSQGLTMAKMAFILKASLAKTAWRAETHGTPIL